MCKTNVLATSVREPPGRTSLSARLSTSRRATSFCIVHAPRGRKGKTIRVLVLSSSCAHGFSLSLPPSLWISYSLFLSGSLL